MGALPMFERVFRESGLPAAERKINFGVVFAGHLVGIREVDDQVWQVSFLQYDPGYFDNDQGRVEPGPDPFAPDKLSTM